MGQTLKRRILVAIATVGLSITGCGKSGGAGNSSETTLASLSCKPLNIDDTSLAIVGASTAQAGSLQNYKLNQDPGCSSAAQKIAWKSVATAATAQEGTSFTHTYDKAGEYVVTAQVIKAGAEKATEVSMVTAVVAAQIVLSGPQYGMTSQASTFTLGVPTGVTIVDAQWNFGDSGTVTSGKSPMSHIYTAPGVYTVHVQALDSNGGVATLSQNITVMIAIDGFECIGQMALSGPSEVFVGQPVDLSAYLPPCVGSRVGGLVWSFGDGAPVSGSTSATHTYSAPGTYHISVAVSVLGAPANPMFTLTRDVAVTVSPTPPPPPPPPPVDPTSCTLLGATRSSTSANCNKDAACGVNGTRTDIFKDQITETCRALANESLHWLETSRTQILVSAGECKGQSCELPAESMTGVGAIAAGVTLINGKYYVADGGHLTLYSSMAPEGACTDVQQVRQCANGVLSGSANYVYLLCENGCPGFGPNGAVKSGVTTGVVVLPKTCAYGETGVTDTYYQISDQMCQQGVVNTSNTRQGTIKTPGVCPTYSYVATGTYSACSANCGGTQGMTYVCRDDKGVEAPSDRCGAGGPPVDVTRVCDGNPDAVKRSDAVTSTDDGGSTNLCPSNQIGVIEKHRDMTVTTNFACIDHSVQQASQATTYGAWVEDNYCRDFTPFRCSQDSLNNKQADARYDWMVKCAPTVPVIKEFLEKFADITVPGLEKGARVHLGDKGRVLYATFMDRNGRNKKGQTIEKPWIAPTDASASCDVPASVYVAGVCVSSCATPEMQIMAQEKANSKLKYTPVIDAWQNKFAFVATLQSQSTMSAKRVQKTAVDNWITEMMDTDHLILEFHMKSGGVLRLTPNHPLLSSDAFMKQADQFKVGDSLVMLGGIADPIVSITSGNYHGKVYNVFVKSADLHQNIVVTNGYLNGTAFYQNEGTQYLNTAIFRQHLTQGVFGK